tara:strand:+ start:208 stop:444 length:237 start_codon:yes stop_codon:yes gene_type:complete
MKLTKSKLKEIIKEVINEDIDDQLATLRKQKAAESERMRQVWSKETGGDHTKSDAIARKVTSLAKKIKALVAKKEKSK